MSFQYLSYQFITNKKKTSFKKGYDLFARVLILEEIVYAHRFDKR